ncbi:MAG: hypothetical protein R3E79_47065 [Caldilineaceae bacterium]
MEPRIVEPKRQSLLRSLRFLLGIVAVLALTLLLFVTIMQPVLTEFSEMTLLLSMTAGISLLVGWSPITSAGFNAPAGCAGR